MPMTLLEAMILVLFAVWVIKSVVTSRVDSRFRGNDKGESGNDRERGWFWLVVLWLLAATVAMFASPDLRAAAGVWKAYFLEPILFLIVLVSVFKKDPSRLNLNVNVIIKSLGFLVFYVSAFAIFQKLTGIGVPPPFDGSGLDSFRVTAFFGYPNAAPLLLAPIVIFLIGNLLNQKRINLNVILNVIIAALGITAIMFARSTGALVALTAGLLFLFLLHPKRKILFPVLLAVIVIVIVIVPAVRQELFLQDWSGGVRMGMWQETLEMLKDNWFLGAGLAGYQDTFAPYHKLTHIEIFLYPHNIVLNFWSELGLAGLILFLIIILKFFKLGFQTLIGNSNISEVNKNLMVSIMAMMVVLLVHGLVDTPYFKNDLSVLFWLIIGLMIVLSRHGSISREMVK